MYKARSKWEGNTKQPGEEEKALWWPQVLLDYCKQICGISIY